MEYSSSNGAILPNIWINNQDVGHFLYQYMDDKSHHGIFVETITPFPQDTELNVIFQDQQHDKLKTVKGVVSFVNVDLPHKKALNPGMGVRFKAVDPDSFNQLVHVLNRVAYL